MAGVPLEKLFSLLVKTLAKPVANRLKAEAAKHPVVSRYCVMAGQRANYISSRINVFTSGFKFVGVKPLPEEEALARGVNFLSESFVFFVGGTIICVEYWRSEAKSAKKEQDAANKLAAYRQHLESRFDEAERALAEIEATLSPLQQTKLRHLRHAQMTHNHIAPDQHSWSTLFQHAISDQTPSLSSQILQTPPNTSSPPPSPLTKSESSDSALSQVISVASQTTSVLPTLVQQVKAT